MMVKCSRCGRKADTDFKHSGRLCNRCFCEMIEKRIRKKARIEKIFSKDKKFICVGELNRYLVESIAGKLPMDVTFLDTVPDKIPKDYKVIVQDTIDDFIEQRLKALFANKKFDPPKFMSLIDVITDQEAVEFCRFKKINFLPNKKDKKIMKILDSMQKKYAETKFALRRSLEEINVL